MYYLFFRKKSTFALCLATMFWCIEYKSQAGSECFLRVIKISTNGNILQGELWPAGFNKHNNKHITLEKNTQLTIYAHNTIWIFVSWFAFTLMNNVRRETQSFHNQVNQTSCPFQEMMRTISIHVITANHGIIPVIEFIWAALTTNAKILKAISPHNGGNLHSTKCN